MPEPSILLLTAANVLYVFCYGVRDVLWLRILAVMAMTLLLPYYAIKDLSAAIAWQGIFIPINLYWIVQIIRERRPPVMSDDEQKLYDRVFKGSCSAKNMLRLLSRAQWKEAAEGTRLIQRGADVDELLLIHEGAATVEVNGEEIAQLGVGDLVGEMCFMTRERTVANVSASGSIGYISWQRDALEELFAEKIELKSAMHEIIGRDLVQKITSKAADASLPPERASTFDFRSL